MDGCLLCSKIFSDSSIAVENLSSFNEPIVPIHEEPNHRHVLHSHSIRVFDAYMPPQHASLYHAHEKDSVLICLDGAHLTNEIPNKELVPRPPIPSGEIYYRGYASTPFVHRIRNLSTTPFRMLDVEVLTEAGTPLLLNPLPNIFNVVLENDRVRVSKVRLAPMQCTDEVTYCGPRLLAVTEEGKISIASETQSQTLEAGRGSLDMQELARKETIKNLGDTFVEIVIVEAK